MKICMISSPVDGKLKDGIGSHVLELSKNLSRIGCEVHIFCFDDERRDFVLGDIFVHSVRVSLHGSKLVLYPELLFKMTEELNRLTKKHGFDIIHGHGGYYVGAIMSSISRHVSKSVVTIHGVAYDEFKCRLRGIGEFKEGLSDEDHFRRAILAGFYMPFSKVLGTAIYNMTNSNIATCNFLASEASKVYHVPASKIRMVPHSIDPVRFSQGTDTCFRESLGLNQKKVVLYVGQLVARKGLNTLLNAFSLVQKQNPDAVLLYIGKGYMKESLQLQAHKLGIAKSVIIFDKFIPEEDFPKIYSVCDVFVIPSIYEFGVSTCLLQAMSSLKPVIATNVGALPEIVSNNVNGLLVERGNPKQLAESINLLLTEEKYAQELAEKGKKTVLTRFNWATNAQKILKIYEDLLS